MSRQSKTPKGGRAERHATATRALTERKRLRKKRADIHGAMSEAARMRKSKKKGTRDFDQNMRGLGYTVKNFPAIDSGREIPGDVLDKYEAVGR